MNIQEYISSGIIESYVLGIASPEEQVAFESMSAAHPEVRAAREAFEIQLEEQALREAVAPPSLVRERVFNSIAADPVQPKIKIEQASPLPAPVVNMRWYRFTAAASIILLLGSTLLNYYFFSQYKDYSSRYAQLLDSQHQLASANQVMQTKLHDYESAMNMMKDPQMAIVKMPGMAASPAPNGMATVYWNTRSKDVYLLVNQLPQPATDKQYQLWAMVDGQPVDAGVFDMNEGPSFVKMKNIPRAQAFAITLEKKGGSTAPTMPIYVLGKVTG